MDKWKYIKGLTCLGERSSVASSSINSVLKKIPRNRREKLKTDEEKDRMMNNNELCNENFKNSETRLRVPKLSSNEIRSMRNYPSYKMGRSTIMISKLWNLTRVTVRVKTENKNEFDEDILEKELFSLGKISHPHILLLMGVCPANDDQSLQLVFEHVRLGSLYEWMHRQGKVPTLTHCADIIIQITDALIFLHNLHFLHCAITSHAVQLVSTSFAKLGQFEFVTDARQTEGLGLAEHSQSLLGCAGWQCLYNWLCPEVLRGEAVSKLSDVYSLCCVVYELSTGTIPWAQMSADRIKESVKTEGVSLPVDQETMPADLYQLLSKGLQANPEHRDLDLHEIRDVFQRIKQSIEQDDRQKVLPVQQKILPSKPCPTRSLSSSAIQYNQHRYLRNKSQRNSSYNSSDYSFVSNQAKRNFLRSQPSSPSRQIGLGPRSKTSIFYDTFSLSTGLDLSSSGSSTDQPGDTSDSSLSSASPTSGYSSYELLDQVQPSYQDVYPDMGKRRSGIFLSAKDSKKLEIKGPIDNPRRSRSVPRITRLKNPQDYVTGIKPASHRLESHSSNCTVHSNFPGSTLSTPKHSTASSIICKNVQKQFKSTHSKQKEFLNTNTIRDQKKYSSTNCFLEKFLRQDDHNEDFIFPRTKVANDKNNDKQMTRNSLCQSHPRLFSKVSSESGYGSSSPTCLTGNMQLSNRYKSSAELVSELLQRPDHLTSVQRRSQKIDPNGTVVNQSSDAEGKKKTQLIKSKSDSQKICAELKSVELVRNIKTKERKVGRDEGTNHEMPSVEKQTAKMTNQTPLKAKLQSVTGWADQFVAGKRLKCDPVDPADPADPAAQPVVQTSPKDYSDQSLKSTASSSVSSQSSEGYELRCYPYSRKQSSMSVMSTLSSRPSACSSLSYSLGDTEDLYCDDELHPSLENDPNMRLYTENINTDQHLIDCRDSQRVFDIADDESILSMEIPSTGPQSLMSCSNIDTASFISECEDRVHMGDARYSTIIAWGVDQNTDISSEE